MTRPLPLRGPHFGSYAADEVGWLLSDLSAVQLEAPTEEREEAVQSGQAHYAESLPVEYQPSAQYQQMFESALQANAQRVAQAVGVVTEKVLARGARTVVSLARAGVPVGILMRRYAQSVHEVRMEHYAVSIVRGKGIDTAALDYIAAHHDPSTVVFVDGWTGKGAITRELSAALAQYARETGVHFSDDLAVLADPGSCAPIFGTREDYLIPSACLNSTVSGLISRTVLNDLIAAGQYHGAKFYNELSDADVSNRLLEVISAHFDQIKDALGPIDDQPAELTWSGWKAVEQISAQYGIHDVNLVKPGVGETTRVLLRRVPWKILIDPDRRADLEHILLLAQQRNVPIEEVSGLPYASIGLIHPRFTRGATGFDGKAAS